MKLNFLPNPRRPPKQWFRDCVRGVRSGGSARDPEAVCGAQWQKMSESKKRAAVRRENPWNFFK